MRFPGVCFSSPECPRCATTPHSRRDALPPAGHEQDRSPHDEQRPQLLPQPRRPTNGRICSERPEPDPRATPNIADRFADLLAPLSARRRRGLIARLSVGYYEGWRPSRAEVAELVAQELRRSPR